MNMDTKGPGFTRTARRALLVLILGVGGSAGATVMHVGRDASLTEVAPSYPKIAAATLAARRAASSSGGGSGYRSTRYGTSSRSYGGGGGYSSGK